jgi:hypothetical protein
MPDRRNYPDRRKQSQSTPEQDFVEAFFRGIGQIISFLFKGAGRGANSGERNARFTELRDHWQDVELHLLQPDTAALAVGEADKILDAAFQAIGISGQSMGERLKAATGWLPNELYQRVWDAHKLRNSLAHEIGVSVAPQEAQRAVSAIREALYHLKILV